MCDYCRISMIDVQEMCLDVYLFFMREAYIHTLSQSEAGREYLEDCWCLEQTKPDRAALREKYGTKEV